MQAWNAAFYTFTCLLLVGVFLQPGCLSVSPSGLQEAAVSLHGSNVNVAGSDHQIPPHFLHSDPEPTGFGTRGP